jgi:ribosomal protein L12E/L44/L45/RPP1/RPP2
MPKETKIPVETYARMHRTSIYSVIRQANRGALKATIEEVDGRKVTYIMTAGSDSVASAAPEAAAPAAESEAIDYKAAYEALKKEMEVLKGKE